MKKCIFTIVAKNYIGLAQILEKSIQQHESVDFYIVIADEAKGLALPPNVLIAKDVLDYQLSQWTNMSFKYNLTEFCTAIKPAVFLYLLSRGYDDIIYFDPDIYVFAPLTKVWDALTNHDMVLTPHVSGIHPSYQGESEWTICVTGIFNLGFCAIHNSKLSTQAMLWWKKRLETNAFCDRSVGTFTDQKWMDWMPGLMGDKLYVLRDLGMNIAPWNYFERKIIYNQNNQLQVIHRFDDCDADATPLVFMHFSGYDYSLLMNGAVSHQRLQNAIQYDDIKTAIEIYSKALAQSRSIFNAYLNQAYSYSTYDNGQGIDNFHRKLYDGLIQNGTTIGNPFATTQGSFYSMLKKKRLLTKESIDKLTPQNYHNVDTKIKILNRFFALICAVIGYKRYPLFVKSLYHYAQPQHHFFLIKK
ncbi:MAG: hypothetical protein MJZ64_06415 [Paludibacteraceae bacterium]|nr:hypothetical protein [Paludibacteraceae bacterium]